MFLQFSSIIEYLILAVTCLVKTTASDENYCKNGIWNLVCVAKFMSSFFPNLQTKIITVCKNK